MLSELAIIKGILKEEKFKLYKERMFNVIHNMPLVVDAATKWYGILIQLIDDPRDLLRRILCLLCKLYDLFCHDSKSAACLTGSCTFDRCIQCKKIRLAGNI